MSVYKKKIQCLLNTSTHRVLLKEEPRRLLPLHYLEDDLSVGDDIVFV